MQVPPQRHLINQTIYSRIPLQPMETESVESKPDPSQFKILINTHFALLFSKDMEVGLLNYVCLYQRCLKSEFPETYVNKVQPSHLNWSV